MTTKTFFINLKKTTWKQAILANNPNTPKSYDIWKVGNQYKLPKLGKRELVLVNGLKSWDEVIQYAKDNQLGLTSPYEIFALGIDFKKELEQTYGWVVATTECQYEGYRRACYVWWNGTERRASLNWVEYFDTADVWFAFSRDLDSGEVGTSDLESRIESLEENMNKIKKFLIL